jgi:hypothetical protein
MRAGRALEPGKTIDLVLPVNGPEPGQAFPLSRTPDLSTHHYPSTPDHMVKRMSPFSMKSAEILVVADG